MDLRWPFSQGALWPFSFLIAARDEEVESLPGLWHSRPSLRARAGAVCSARVDWGSRQRSTHLNELEKVVAQKYRAGMDVDIYCTKCRANAVGAINAMMGQEIVQITCKICGSGPKKYRAAKGKGGPPSASPRQRSSSTTSGARSKPKVIGKSMALSPEEDLALWQARRNAAGSELPKYDIRETYIFGDAFKHPKFGMGSVEGLPGDGRMEVLFEQGRKLLIMGYVKK